MYINSLFRNFKEMNNLPYTYDKKVTDLAKTGLTNTGQCYVMNWMLARANGRMADRITLLNRLKFATDPQKAAAMEVFDEFVAEFKKS